MKNFKPHILKLIIKALGGEELETQNFDVLCKIINLSLNFNNILFQNENSIKSKVHKLGENAKKNNLNIIRKRKPDKYIKDVIINELGNITFIPLNFQII